MSSIINEERERILNLHEQGQETSQKTQLLSEENENLTSYNGRPTLDALLIHKDIKQKVTVDATYLIELVEYFEKQSGFSVEEFINSHKRHRETDLRNDDLRKQNEILHQKVKDVIVENTLAYDEIEKLQEGLENTGIVKLPIRKINTFLSLCKPSELKNDDMFFYVKLDSNNSMSRITRTKEELQT